MDINMLLILLILLNIYLVYRTRCIKNEVIAEKFSNADLADIRMEINKQYNIDVESIRNLGAISKSLLTGTNYHSTIVGTPGQLTIPADNTLLQGNLAITGMTQIDNGLTIKGGATIEGDIAARANITVGDIAARGYISAPSLISLQDTEVRRNLAVNGQTRVATLAASDYVVATTLISEQDTEVRRNLTVGDIAARGNITVGDVAARGYISATSLISVQDTEVRRNFHVDGNTNIKGNLTVGGNDVTIKGSLTVGGNVRFNAKNTNIMDILPRGIIMIWFGSYETIPPGWVACFGDGDIPDLRYNMVCGASGASGWQNGDGGGVAENVIKLANLPPQNMYKCPQPVSSGGWTNFLRGDDWGGSTKVHPEQASAPLNNRPPYKTLYYIMKG